MSQHFKVHELLDSAGLEALEAFAREPGRTVDECHAWMRDRGHDVSRSAVGAWKQSFDSRLMAERMSAAGGLAKAFMAAAKSDGGLQIPDAAVLQMSQMIFEHAARLATGGEVETRELADLGLALQRTTLAKVRVENVRSAFLKREQQAVDAASKVAQSGGKATDVVDTIKRALGLVEEAA